MGPKRCRGWGPGGPGGKPRAPPKVTLPLRLHARMGFFITYPSCKLSNLEHTIYP